MPPSTPASRTPGSRLRVPLSRSAARENPSVADPISLFCSIQFPVYFVNPLATSCHLSSSIVFLVVLTPRPSRPYSPRSPASLLHGQHSFSTSPSFHSSSGRRRPGDFQPLIISLDLTRRLRSMQRGSRLSTLSSPNNRQSSLLDGIGIVEPHGSITVIRGNNIERRIHYRTLLVVFFSDRDRNDGFRRVSSLVSCVTTCAISPSLR